MMRPITPCLRKLMARVRRDRLDDQLRDEISLHIDLRRQQLIDDGMDPCDAEVAARRMFGNVTAIREEARSLWSTAMLDTLWQDVRYGGRVLARSPGFAAVAVLSLAAGIGATAAVFNVADAVVFRPLPVRAPHELREMRISLEIPGSVKKLAGVPASVLTRMQESADFGALLGSRVTDDVAIGIGGAQHTVRVEFVSANYFEVLGVAPASGGLRADGAGLSPMPVIVSERLWRAALAGDPAVSGRTVTINGVPAVVSGVVRFRGLVAERPADVFAPLAAAPLVDSAAAAGARVVVRVHRGVPLAEAEQKIATLYKAFNTQMMAPDALRITLADARRGISDARETLARPLLFGLMLAAVLLLVACANTGALVMTRFASRQGEFWIRAAIGAAPSRLARQVTVEALLLAVVAALAGLAIAGLGAPLLLASIPLGSMPTSFDVRFDWRLAGFTAVLAAVSALTAAGASLSRLLRTDAAAIGRHARSVADGRRRLTRGLIAAQVACSLLLLVAAGSMTRTLLNLRSVDPGFDPGESFAVAVDASAAGVDARALPAYFSSLHERVAAVPGVARASFAHLGLMMRSATTGSVNIPGWLPASPGDEMVRLFWIGPDFLETVGMRLVLGHGIGRHESAGRERVAVVNHEFARFYFGSAEGALGRVVNGDVRIVGVVADARYNTLRDEPARAMFLPHTQAPTRPAMTFVIRPAGDPAAAASAVMASIRAVDPRLRMTAAPVAALVSATLSRERFVAMLALVLSVLALFLCCAGLYATVSYSGSQRRRELAVRLALGASRGDVFRLMLRDPSRTTAIGIAAGIPASYVLMRAMSALLFGVSTFDLLTIAACGLALGVTTMAAAVWPARRAAAINPSETLANY